MINGTSDIQVVRDPPKSGDNKKTPLISTHANLGHGLGDNLRLHTIGIGNRGAIEFSIDRILKWLDDTNSMVRVSLDAVAVLLQCFGGRHD